MRATILSPTAEIAYWKAVAESKEASAAKRFVFARASISLTPLYSSLPSDAAFVVVGAEVVVAADAVDSVAVAAEAFAVAAMDSVAAVLAAAVDLAVEVVASLRVSYSAR